MFAMAYVRSRHLLVKILLRPVVKWLRAIAQSPPRTRLGCETLGRKRKEAYKDLTTVENFYLARISRG